MASIREIAERANVSPGTVSRYLNNKGYMSQETRKKIEKVLAEVDYVPNELAKNLSTNSSHMIGVILPDIEHPFFLGIIKKLVIELKKREYGVALWITEYKDAEEREYLERLRRNVVDGAVVMTPMLENTEYQRLGRPLVSLDKEVEGIADIPIDHENSGRLAARKLYKDGCRNVLTIAGEASEKIPSLKRHKTFLEETEKLGGRATVYYADWSSFEPEYYIELARKIVKEYPGVDGVYAADILANAFWRVKSECGQRVPEDFEIISTDGVYENNNAIIRLSAVIQPADEIAKRIAESIVGQIIGAARKMMDPVQVYLFEGDTTK